MNFQFILFLLIFILNACSSPTHYNDRALERVKISDRLPPRSHCKEIEVVFASVNDRGDNLEEMMKTVRRKLKEKSIEAGGNYVRIETNNTTTYKNRTIVVLSGTSYLCLSKNSGQTLDANLKDVPENPDKIE